MELKYQTMPVKAKLYIGAVCATGTLISIIGLSLWRPHNLTRVLCFLVVAAIASALKVSLPTITGTMSVNFLFILIGIVELDFPSTLIIGCTGSLIQCLWKSRTRPKPYQVVFNTSAMALSPPILSPAAERKAPRSARPVSASMPAIVARLPRLARAQEMRLFCGR